MITRLFTRATIGGLTLAATIAFAAATAHAQVVLDPAGDFVPTHTGPANADLDVVLATAGVDGKFLSLLSIQNGDIGLTPGASYVWGIDRGAGTPGLTLGTPSVGVGILFDAVVVLRGNGTGTVTAFNAIGAPTSTALAAGSVDIFGAALGGLVSLDLLPSRGFAFADYTVNLWTRSAGGNAGIADFALEGGNFAVAAVPEPGTWAMLITGFAAVGVMRRRASRTVAA